MATKKKAQNALAAVPMFEHLTKKQLATVASHVTWTTRPEGTELVQQGGLAKQLLIIVEGTAKVVRGKRKIADLKAGDIIGELSLLDPEPATASVTATSDVTLLVLSGADFFYLISNENNFAKNILRQVAKRLRDTDKQLVA